MARQRPDLIHAPYFLHPYSLPAPTVTTLYDVIPLRLPQDYGYESDSSFGRGMAAALLTSRLTLAISQATADDFRPSFLLPARRVRVTPLAPGAAYHPQSEAAIAATRQRHGLPPIYVLYVGSNKPHKNLPRLIDAWGRIAGRHPSVPLVIAGHWDADHPRGAPTRRGALLGRPGALSRPRVRGRSARTVWWRLGICLSSLYEGFGCLCWRRWPAARQWCAVTPPACPKWRARPPVLVDPRDIDGLAAALDSVLSDEALRAELAERSLARAALFTWSRTARLTIRAYREALHRH